jgi:cyclophilin family peptidyl-prolyl cis-trans isomerase/HEAT repeat protein
MKTSTNQFLFPRGYLCGAFLSLVVAFAGCSPSDDSPDSVNSSTIARIVLAEDSRTISEELTELLRDPNPQIRALASRAIGRIGIDSAPLEEVSSALLPNLRDSVVAVASMTAFAYGLLPKDSTLANTLVEYAFTAPEEPALSAIVAAGRLADSANTQVIQKMMILLNHPQASYRSHTAMALFLCGAKSTIDELSRVALSDKVKNVRDTALYALARMGAGQAKDVYLTYLNDTNSYLQSLALRGLIAVKDTTLASQVTAFLSTDNVNLRSQAIATLGALRCKLAKDALVNAVNGEKDHRLKAQALGSLTSFSGERDDQLAEWFLKEHSDLGLQSAAVSYLAGSFNGVLSPILDSVLRHGNPQLLSAFFDGINRDLPKKRLYQFSEELLHAPPYNATGPAYYSAYALYDKLELKPDDWMTGKSLWSVITSDTDFVIKTSMLEYAGRRKSPWLFDVALPLARFIKSDDTQIRALEYQDLYRSLLTATESYLDNSPESLKSASEQIKLNVREIFETLLLAKDFIVSKQAAENLKKYFQIDALSRVRKPQPQYDAKALAKKLATAKEQSKYVRIKLGSGELTIELDFDAAPLTCLNFLKLVKDGFYDNLVFHRVVPNFVAQGGDPRGDGWGGPGYSIRCEYSQNPYVRGAVGIATSGKDTGGSQFFITLSAQPHLDARYTVFGRVIEGMDIADSIRKGDPGTIALANAPAGKSR